MSAIRVTIKGAREIERKLRKFDRRRAARVGRSALGRGAGHLNREFKKATPTPSREVLKTTRRYSGEWGRDGIDTNAERKALRRSVGRRRKTYSAQGLVFEAIGPRHSYQDAATGSMPSAYAYRMEYGEGVPSQPWMRPVFDRNTRKAIALISRGLRERLYAEMRKG